MTLAANQNNAKAQNALGMFYLDGEYIRHDVNKGLYYLTLSANQNYEVAQYNLGYKYCNGYFVQKK